MLQLGWEHLRRILEFWKGQAICFPLLHSSQCWSFEPGKTILSLSPHSDDDVIGWGGWLHMNHLEGNRIVSVCLTDGSAGGGALYQDKAELVQMRKKEAEEAAKLLGISKVLFWDQPDGKLTPDIRLIERLHLLMGDYKPDIIVLPSFLDDHPDHRSTADLLARYLSSHPRRNLICLQGEIWTPLPHWNTYISIDGVLDVKRRAIEVFATQLDQADFVDAFLGLARYRGVTTISGARFVECFLESTPGDYVRMWRAMRLAGHLGRLLKARVPTHRHLAASLLGCFSPLGAATTSVERRTRIRSLCGG